MKNKCLFLYICFVIVANVCFFACAGKKGAAPSQQPKDVKVEETVVDTPQKTPVTKVPVSSQIAEDWEAFIEAVIWMESRGVERCVGDNGEAVGVLQIHPIMVREANRILAMQNIKTVYSYDDRYSREKSIEMFKIVQEFYNKEHDIDVALRVWNRYHPESYKTQIVNKYTEYISI